MGSRRVRPQTVSRAILAVILTLAVAGASPAAAQPGPIAFVQSNYAVPQSPQTTVTVLFPAAQTAGNLNVVGTLTTGAGTSFTARMITNPDGDLVEDRIVAAAGSYSATAPLSPAGYWIMQLVAFAAPGAGPDTSAPTTTITTPTSGSSYTTNTSPLILGGTATDNVGVTQVSWTNSQGGTGTATGTTTW